MNIFLIHKISVWLFLTIYLVKTTLLLANKSNGLKTMTRFTKIPEMLVSVLFLLTGLYLILQLPEINTLMMLKLVAVFASIPIAIIGFKKSNKVLAATAMLLLIGAYGLAEMSRKPKAVNGAIPGNAQSSYTAYCVKCHGDDGKLGVLQASDLTLSGLEDLQMREIIRNGKNSMPAFSGNMNEKEIEALADYVKTLRLK